jgi:hypothetical protein
MTDTDRMQWAQAEIDRLTAELDRFKPQPMSQNCRDGKHNGTGASRCINCWCLCHNRDADVEERWAVRVNPDGCPPSVIRYVDEGSARAAAANWPDSEVVSCQIITTPWQTENDNAR